MPFLDGFACLLSYLCLYNNISLDLLFINRINATSAAIINIISPILDENDIIKESYILDITSKERGE